MASIIINGSNKYYLENIDCFLVESEKINKKTVYSIAFYHKILVDRVDEAGKPYKTYTTEKVVIESSKTTDQLDVWDDYRDLCDLFKDHGFATIELVNPAIIINYLNIDGESGNKNITLRPVVKETNWKTQNKLFAKIRKLEIKLKSARKNKISEDLVATIKFKSGLEVEHAPNQPSKFTARIFDKAPTLEDRRRDNEYFALKEQAKRDERRRHLARIAHEVLKEQAKRRTVEANLSGNINSQEKQGPAEEHVK